MRIVLSRRRRLTTAALVLLTLGGGLWWSTSPKIDPRFVGEWKCSDEPVALVLRSDGRCGSELPVVPNLFELPLDWHVEGDRLLFVVRREQTLRGLMDRVEDAFKTFLGRPVIRQVWTSAQIVEVTPTTLRTEWHEGVEPGVGRTFERLK